MSGHHIRSSAPAPHIGWTKATPSAARGGGACPQWAMQHSPSCPNQSVEPSLWRTVRRRRAIVARSCCPPNDKQTRSRRARDFDANTCARTDRFWPQRGRSRAGSQAPSRPFVPPLSWPADRAWHCGGRRVTNTDCARDVESLAGSSMVGCRELELRTSRAGLRMRA